jgi:hypothetical protein
MNKQGQLFEQEPARSERKGSGKRSKYDRFREQIEATLQAYAPHQDEKKRRDGCKLLMPGGMPFSGRHISKSGRLC